MQQIVPFADERLSGYCVYCGSGHTSTRDHVPSKVLLDPPFPENLPVVAACRVCNEGFSCDELYFACVLESIVSGGDLSTMRPRIARRLRDSPELWARIQSSQIRDLWGQLNHQVELDCIRRVVLKLAKGHVAFETSEPHLEAPRELNFTPISAMPDSERRLFLERPMSAGLQPWPEIGSRAFVRAVDSWANGSDPWLVVQPGRYEYMANVASDGIVVRMLIRDYLAAEARFD